MHPVRLRLSEFCTFAGGDNKQTVRSIVARDEAPFAYSSEDGGQRTYDAGDLLAWCLYIQLRNLGVAAAEAAETVRSSGAVRKVFETEARGGDLSDLFLVFARDEVRGSDGRLRVFRQHELWTSDELSASLRKGAGAYGRVTAASGMALGLSGVSIVPVLPCLQRSRDAVAGKYIAKGPVLYRKEA